MSYLYITDNGSTISIKENKINVTKGNEIISVVPIDTIENINIIGCSHMTTPCTIECLKRGIPVSYHSKAGRYYGKLENTGKTNVDLQRKQAMLYYSVFSVKLGKKIIQAKLKNQEIMLHRYARYRRVDVSNEIFMIRNSYNRCVYANDISQLMGYEGMAARYYFIGLSKLVEEDFKFSGRSKRPPRDEFNAMLSLGYSVIHNEIYGKLQNRGLNPYFGFVHRDKPNHATLASDMMEEWRPIIVDSVVMSMVNGHEISLADFERNAAEPGVYFTKEGLKKFLAKLERRMNTEVKYFSGLDTAVSFRKGLDVQVNMLAKAVQHENADLYNPVVIRG